MFKGDNSFYSFISTLLIIVIFTNIFIIGFMGNTRAEAGFFSNNKDGIMTVLKGAVMFWMINLMSKGSSGDSDDSFLTSTIKNGLGVLQGDSNSSPSNSNSDQSTSKQDNKKDQSNLPKNDPAGGQGREGDGDSQQSADPNQNNDSGIEINKTDDSSQDSNNQSDKSDQTNQADKKAGKQDERENQSTPLSISTKKEERLLDLINKVRKEKGIRPLQMEEELVKIARKKAQDMIENDYFAHNSPALGSPFVMLEDRGIEYGLAGENLAGAETVNKGYQGLMDSAEHRKNILNTSYDQVGIGIVEGGPYGMMIVQLFIDDPEPQK